jgi:sn-glycerol 3-phosphate transport system ATP-binding protein
VPLVLGIRPEHLSAHDDGPIEVSVDLVEQLGADSLVYGSLQNMNGAEPKEICVRVEEAVKHKIDDKVKLWFDTDRAMVFREDSGERLI